MADDWISFGNDEEYDNLVADMEAVDNAVAKGRVGQSGDLLDLMTAGACITSPAILFDTITAGGVSSGLTGEFEIVAQPGDLVTPGLVRSGDLYLRRGLADGNLVHAAALATGEVLESRHIPAAGWHAERVAGGVRPGLYARVIEGGPFPHRAKDAFARRLTDPSGRLPLDSLILRPRSSIAGKSTESRPSRTRKYHLELEPMLITVPTTHIQESISVDDVAKEMDGLRSRFLLAHRATRIDGSVRAFKAGDLLVIDHWNGTAAEVTVNGFDVPKLVMEPAPDSDPGIRPYNVALDAQRTAVTRNARELANWVAREGDYLSNHGNWLREKARLTTLLARRQTTYSRMWVRQMMYNRFDVVIALWVSHYNTQLRPATALDPNIVKSMLYQESRMGTAGAHLMPLPSDWSSASRHPIRSRFNIGQAIDSWGPQQWLMMREMGASIFLRHGLSAFNNTWQSMSNDDYAAHAPFIRALREFFEFRDMGNRNLMGTTGRDLHEDYGFWIRAAVRWLFVKYANLRTRTWAEAVRAYNGSGARARAYRDAVMGRVGSTKPYPAESLDSVPNGVAGEDGVAIAQPPLQEDAPRLDRSAILTWEDLIHVPGSRGQRHVFYVLTGAPSSLARIGDEGKAIFHLRVRNTNTVYNHQDVVTKYRVLDVLPNRQFRQVKSWRSFSGPDLEDETSRVIVLALGNQTLLAAYNPDSPVTRLEVEYHWRETWEDAQQHYNQTGLDFVLVAPIEYYFSRKKRLTMRDVELNDPARYKADYWIPITGIDFTADIRQPVTIHLDVTSSVSGSTTGQATASGRQTRSTARATTISNTFSMQFDGEVSQGGSGKATIGVLELGVQQMFKLGASLGYSRTRTDTQSTTVAHEFARSLMLSRTYATSYAMTTRTTITVSPPEVPQPLGTGSDRRPAVRTVGAGSVGVYLYPLVAFFEVPYVRFEGINAMGQATRRSEGRVAVPFVTEWRLTSHRGS